MSDIGRVLIVVGALLLVLGLLFTFGAKVPFLGKMPGDIVYRHGNFTFHFPIVTSIVLSLLLTLLFSLLRR